MRFNQLVLRLSEGPAHRLLPSGLTRSCAGHFAELMSHIVAANKGRS